MYTVLIKCTIFYNILRDVSSQSRQPPANIIVKVCCYIDCKKQETFITVVKLSFTKYMFVIHYNYIIMFLHFMVRRNLDRMIWTYGPSILITQH